MNKDLLMDVSRRKKPGRVLLCGLGLRLEHMTVETLQALKKCDIVFHDFLDEKAAIQVRALCADLRNLTKLRRDESEEATTDVILAAVAPGKTIAFLCYGHPLVLQWTAAHLMHRCRAEGIGYRVTASLTALDDILVEIGTPVISEGLQICLPNKLLLLKIPLLPHVHAMIMLLSHLWDVQGSSVADFVKYLKAFYPPGHRMLLIRCSRVMKDPPLRLETSLRGLAGALKELPEKERFSASLFIPALPKPLKIRKR